jgi:hypothetical protein
MPCLKPGVKSAWSARVDLEALCGCYTAVGRSTMEVVKALRPQQPEQLSAACKDCTTVEGAYVNWLSACLPVCRRQ